VRMNLLVHTRGGWCGRWIGLRRIRLSGENDTRNQE